VSHPKKEKFSRHIGMNKAIDRATNFDDNADILKNVPNGILWDYQGFIQDSILDYREKVNHRRAGEA
jgi:hypothetical protein